MDFLFGGGGGQTSQLSLATAPSGLAFHQHNHDYDLISAATAAASASTASAIHFNGHDNGPILYDNLNRTSAIDDIRSVVIYIFILTIFLSFFLILPGIRNEKFPTFLCITTSLLVSSIIIISLNGTTWHVGEAPISAPYKAFSRDRIQGDLSVRIGLQSVNISLRAHKYYILHATNGPMIMENVQQTFSFLQQPLMMVMMAQPAATTQATSSAPITGANQSHGAALDGHELRIEATSDQETPARAAAPSFIDNDQPYEGSTPTQDGPSRQSLADELLTGRSSDGGLAVESELDSDEPFSSAVSPGEQQQQQPPVLSSRRQVRSSAADKNATGTARRTRRQQPTERAPGRTSARYTVKRLHVDINYNERFYWIGPMQMRQEYQHALERGLPYPILTCVEYLSQDEAGFNWSRQYRAAGYYTSMLLWVSASVCVLMFCLHCAAPKYGIYAMQALGLLLLCTNLTYATLVPRGDQKLVIPFEGQSVTFRLGWNFWLVLVGGCLSILVGTTIVIIDKLFPNFIFTTVLDVNFDSSSSRAYFQKKQKTRLGRSLTDDTRGLDNQAEARMSQGAHPKKPKAPPFIRNARAQLTTTKRPKQIANNNSDREVARHKVGGVHPIDAKLLKPKGKRAPSETDRVPSSHSHVYESIGGPDAQGQSKSPAEPGDTKSPNRGPAGKQEITVRL